MSQKKIEYQPPDGLIISPSGMRGEVGNSLTIEAIIRFTKSFGLWLGPNSKVLIGRDTRNSGLMISSAVISALTNVGIHVMDAGITPTPAILYYIRKHNIDGAIIISGSHNPPNQNGLKYISRTHTFLGNEELEEINKYFLYSKEIKTVPWNQIGSYKKQNINTEYLNGIKKTIQKSLFRQKKLNIVIDANAGAGVGITDKVLRQLGCEVKTINSEFVNYPNYPRPIEPIKPHLEELSKAVRDSHADIGFAHDCDADRVAMVGPDGTIYPEDITVILLLRYILEVNKQSNTQKKVLIVTNTASSLLFEKIASKYNTEVIRTPIGERHLAMQMNQLLVENPDFLIFGGEGSSGGFMYPLFNNARDGIFAACMICEMLLFYNKSVKSLIQELPKLYTTREKISTSGVKMNQLIEQLKKELDKEQQQFSIIDNDIKILNMKKEEWVLVHPSNTEPIIRVITESPTENRTNELCSWMTDKIKKLISN